MVPEFRKENPLNAAAKHCCRVRDVHECLSRDTEASEHEVVEL